MYSEEQSHILEQQTQESVIVKKPNVTYSVGSNHCNLLSDNSFHIWNDMHPSNPVYVQLPGLVFSQCITTCQNAKIQFTKEIHTVRNENIMKRKIQDVSVSADLHKNTLDFEGDLDILSFNIGNRSLNFFKRIFSSFYKSFIVATKSDRSYSFSDGNHVYSDNLVLFLNGYDGNILHAFTFKSNLPASFSILNIGSSNKESIYLQYFSSSSSRLLIEIKSLDYTVDSILKYYDSNIAMKVLGYTPVALNYLHSNLTRMYEFNDSHAAIISLVAILIVSGILPYILYILLAILKIFRKKDSKHINDNQDKPTYLIMSILRNWHYVWNIFIIYSIYGISSPRTILQYLNIKDGSVLNGGKTILDADNTFIFMKTSIGYFSIMKLLLIAVLVFKQIYRQSLSDIKAERFRNNVMLFIMLAVVYYLKYSYSFMLVIVLSNLVSLITENLSRINTQAKIKK